MSLRVKSIYILAFSLLSSALWAEWNFGPNEKVNDDTDNAYQNYPSIAVSGEGNVYCAWEDWRDYEETGYVNVYFSYKLKGKSWSKNEKVNDTKGGSGTSIVVDDEEGNVFCGWASRQEGDNLDVYVSNRPFGGIWQPSAKINDDTEDDLQGGPDLAIDPKGNIYAIWKDSRNTGPFGSDLYFSMKPRGGNWAPNEKVNDILGGVLRPCLAVDSAGNCYAVWEDLRNEWEYGDDIYFAFRPKGGSWGPNVRVNDDLDTSDQSYPELAVDPEGNAHCFWVDEREGEEKIYCAYRPAGGNWGANECVEQMFSVPDVEVDAKNNLYAGWSDREAGKPVSVFSYKPFGGKWSSEIPITDNEAVPGSPAIALDSKGNVYCVWVDLRNNNPPVDPPNSDIYFCEGINTGISEIENKDEMRCGRLEIEPNPVSQSVTIRWALTGETLVNLKIYDGTGRVIKILINNQRVKKGEQKVIWDGRDGIDGIDGIGRKVPSGIYFCTLEIEGEVVITKKIILIK